MSRTITNNPGSELPRIPRKRSPITNAVDVGRRFPEKALADEMITEEELDAAANDQFRLFEQRVQFIGEPFAPPASALSQAIAIEATSDQAVRILASEVQRIKIDITGGTAPGKKVKSADGKIVGAVGASITVPVVEGQANIIVEASGAGTLILALDGSVDPRAAVLTTTDTAITTFSA